MLNHYCQGRQSWGVWGRDTPDFGQGVVRVAGGVVGVSWNIIISYRVTYKKYMYNRKLWLLKRNRITCLEVAVSGQFLPGQSISLWNCLINRNCSKICLEKSNCLNCLKKATFSRNLPGNIEMCLIWIHDPQISNQIDAADYCGCVSCDLFVH